MKTDVLNPQGLAMRHHAFVTIDEDNIYAVTTNIIKNGIEAKVTQWAGSYEVAAIKVGNVLLHFNNPGEVTTRLKNTSGLSVHEVFELVKKELVCSGIECRQRENFSMPYGCLLDWRFDRSSYLWEAHGQHGIPKKYVEKLLGLCPDEVFLNRDETKITAQETYGFSVDKLYTTSQRGLLEIGLMLKQYEKDYK